MTDVPRLDTYHFYEEEWDSYEHLRDAFEWEIPDSFNIAEYVCDRHAERRGRVCLFASSDDETRTQETLTFSQVRDRANRLADYLADQGVDRGDRIGVNVGQRPAALLGHLAAWKLGAVSVPLSTLFGPDALAYRLGDCAATACLVDAANVDAFRDARADLDALETVLTVGEVEREADEVALEEALDGQSTTRETATTDAEDDAVIIYTSGTTGDPKGVRHAHRFLLGHLPASAQTFLEPGTTEETVYWTPVEWSWIGSLFSIVMPALYYGCPVVAHDREQFDPEAAFEVLEEFGVTYFSAPPTALRMMMQVDAPDRFEVDTVRKVGSGGESVGESIVEWASDVFEGAIIEEAYGQTEANLLVKECAELTPKKRGSMGLAVPGHEVTIVDPETAEPTVDTGEVGEIAVRYEDDPVCFKEYWNKPEQTDEKVQNGWLLTEDLGRVDEDGYFTFEGRTDDVIISGGYRIGPEEVEDTLASHEAVADAGVIGVPDEERGEVPKAFVVLGEGREPGDELDAELESFVRENLAKYEYPRAFEYIEELPKTSTGKVRRQTLREREGIE